MANSEYQIESATLGYTAGFSGEEVYVKFVGRSKSCELNQVSQVIIKNTPMSGGDELSFRIVYNDSGKEKKFQWVQAKVTSPATQNFLDELEERLPSHVQWVDKRKEVSVDESGNKVYDLQYLPFGYAGAGLPRSVQIWIYLICTAVLILPLIYYIILLMRGGYRIYTNDENITIRKMRDTILSWDEIKEVDITRVNVVNRESWTKTDVLKLKFIGNKKKKSVVMRYDHAAPLLKELGKREVLTDEIVNQLT